jgi:hypothetical protein
VKKKTELFLDYVEAICGVEPEYYKITEQEEHPAVLVASFSDFPASGHTTSFSFGLSSYKRTEWVYGRPELMISVKSTDVSWGLAMGEMIRNARGTSTFRYGTILNFEQPVADDSKIDSFLVLNNSLLPESQSKLALPDYVVNIAQLYPVFHEEWPIIDRIGPVDFVRTLGIDFSDVHRQPIADRKK